MAILGTGFRLDMSTVKTLPLCAEIVSTSVAVILRIIRPDYAAAKMHFTFLKLCFQFRRKGW